MISGKVVEERNDHHADAQESERGTTLILVAAVMLVLIGMAGFAVDLGWLYSQATEAQKSAESAALAGVVHMPISASEVFDSSEAHDTALDIADRLGYRNDADGTVTP